MWDSHKGGIHEDTGRRESSKSLGRQFWVNNSVIPWPAWLDLK